MRPNIAYHTRLSNQHSVKLSGGSFGGAFGLETANRLASAMFTARVSPSGAVRFVDGQGREVSLYMTVDPAATDIGKAALAEHHRKSEAERERARSKAAQIEALLDGMTADEALARLQK